MKRCRDRAICSSDAVFDRGERLRVRLALRSSRRVCAVLLCVAGMGWSVRASAGLGRSKTPAAQGYLGLGLRELPEEVHGKGTHVVEIARVDHDGPAGKAGLREHDMVVQFNGQAIGSVEQLRKMLRETTPGMQVNLLVVRDGQQLLISTQMANREEVERRAWEQHVVVVDPDAAEIPGPPAQEDAHSSVGFGFLRGGTGGSARPHGFLGSVLGSPYTGVTVEPLSAQLGEFFGVQSGAGLLVKQVEVNSPGAMAGLRAGDVVIKANQVTMTNESDWTRQLHECRGRSMSVLVVRDRREQTMTLTPDAKHKSRLEVPGGEAARTAMLAGMSLLRID